MATASKTAKPLAQTISRFGRRYAKQACSKLKSEANKKAESIRAKGFTAMVVEDKARGTYCTFKGKKAAISGTKTTKRKTTTTAKRKTTTTTKKKK